MKIIGVIPSRYASTRLPGKPLVDLAGKPLIHWVWEAASRATSLDSVLVATDDERIARVVRDFGGKVAMTSPECPSGTDRIAEAIHDIEADIVVNLQGDEPLMSAVDIDACVKALCDSPDAAVSTSMVEINDVADFNVSSVVKVVTDSSGYALYFSRAPIPDWSRLSEEERKLAPAPMKHLGLYVYRRDALEAFTKMPPSRYERIEKLEQLRFLEAGYRIRVIGAEFDSIGVDTPEDAAAVGRLLLNNTR